MYQIRCHMGESYEDLLDKDYPFRWMDKDDRGAEVVMLLVPDPY